MKQRTIRSMAGRAPALLLLALVGAAGWSQSHVTPVVVTARIDSAIFQPTDSYIARALERAERARATCLLVEMNTPGGSGQSMRDIARRFLSSHVPVVVYVAPSGAQAASAGAIIGLSANVLAMATGTNIGAAHPVMGTGADIPGDMRKKAENDFAAFARSLAEKRGRNPSVAQDFVLNSVSLTETEAVKQKIADFVAHDRTDLLLRLEGRKVETAGGPQTLHTNGARIDEEQPTWVEAFLLFLFNPNVALVLGAIAMYGIIAEIQNPGAILPGVAGSIALVLMFYTMSVLSVNATGVVLLLLSLALFVVDIYAPTHGILTAGAVIAFVLGGFLLFGDSMSGLRVSWTVLISLALLNALFFGFVVTAGVRTLKKPPGSGPETLIGKRGEARTPLDPMGKVFMDGAIWTATNAGEEPIAQWDEVIVESRDGLTLRVRRAAAPEAGPIYATASQDPPGAA